LSEEWNDEEEEDEWTEEEDDEMWETETLKNRAIS